MGCAAATYALADLPDRARHRIRGLALQPQQELGIGVAEQEDHDMQRSRSYHRPDLGAAASAQQSAKDDQPQAEPDPHRAIIAVKPGPSGPARDPRDAELGYLTVAA